MKKLTRAEILNAKDIRTERVNCPEWGGYVFVRGLSARERDKWESSLYETKRVGNDINVIAKRDDLLARFVAISVVDESGTLMFAPADIEALSQKSASAMARVFTQAQKLSGFTNEDLAELEKNLNKAPEDTSTTN